ncbi:MAG: hypothetical protein WBP03_01685 [Candidatus Saccharimonadales bacterium]
MNEEEQRAQPVVLEENAVDETTQAPSEEPHIPVSAPAEITTQPQTRNKKKRLIVITVALAVLGAALGAGYLWGQAQHKVPPVKSQAAPTPQKPQQKVTPAMIQADPTLEKFMHPTTGEVWYTEPKTIARQGWMNSEYLETYQSAGTSEADAQAQYEQMLPDYYLVGSRGTHTIIMVKAKAMIGQPYARFFERGGDNSVVAILKPSATATYDQYYLPSVKDELKLSKISTLDETTHYDSLSLPDAIMLKNGESVVSTKDPFLSFGNTYRAEGTTQTTVMALGGSTLYRMEKTYADTKLTNIGYTVQTALGPELQVDYVPNTLSLEKYTFDNGRAATYTDYTGKTLADSLHGIAKGCGGTTAAVTKGDALTAADLVHVGKTDTGRAVYSMKNQQSTLMTKAYDEFTQSDTENHVSLADFIANHGLLIIDNASGEHLVYVRDQYSPVGGCAKPVVYMYPQKAQSVSVRVDADVKVSDPLYGPTGWRGVWAEPSGKLTYEGHDYDSLFWEGTGVGDYPAIRSGTVVKRAQAAQVMRSQLDAQGLTQKERDDFMAYWEPKIPAKPYVRLTWFTTAEMNRLAPLSIAPRPDTVIRVFLDMDGFDQPISLPAQKLTKHERRGFTVVEWGGLTTDMKNKL